MTDRKTRRPGKRRGLGPIPHRVRRHGSLGPDLMQILSEHQPSSTTRARNDKIKEAVTRKLDSGYQLVDLSLGAYAVDLDFADLRLAVTNPHGSPSLSPLTEEDRRPAYSHAERKAIDYLSTLQPTDDISIQELERYDPLLPRLVALLQAYGQAHPALPHMISILVIWTRAHGIERYFPPLTLALMTVAFLQSNGRAPNLQDASHVLTYPPHDIAAIIPATDTQPSRKVSIDTRFCTPPGPRQKFSAKHLGELLAAWFTFYSTYPVKRRFISVRNGGHRLLDGVSSASINMQSTYGQVGEPLDGPESDWKEPQGWRHVRLVVQDPFLPNISHTTFEVSVFDNFASLCKDAYEKLDNGLPARMIFHKPATDVSKTAENDESSDGLDIILSPKGKKLHPDILTHLQNFVQRVAPSPQTRIARLQTIGQIQQAVQTRFGSDYVVETFGSTRYGVDNDSSDLDIVIIDKKRSSGFLPDVHPNEYPAIYNMNNLANVMRKAGFSNVQPIKSAATPIVKAIDPRTNIHIDINVNEQLGYYNTLLIQHYITLAPTLLQPMLLFIKMWAKSCGLNDPSAKIGQSSMSSYCYTLMTIGFLQMHGILPNLQANLPPPKPQDGFWVRRRKHHVWCDARFHGLETLQWAGPTKQMSLDQAIVEWFRYWGIEHNYARDMIDVKSGGLIQRQHRFKVPKAIKKGKGKKEGGAKKKDKGKSKATTGSEVQVEFKAQVVGDSVVDPTARGTVIVQAGESGSSRQNVVVQDAESEVPLHEILDTETQLEEALEELAIEEDGSESDIYEEEPPLWSQNMLVIPDPFILLKNCGSHHSTIIQRFKAEARRSYHLLTSSQPISSVLATRSAQQKFKLLAYAPNDPQRDLPPRSSTPSEASEQDEDDVPRMVPVQIVNAAPPTVTNEGGRRNGNKSRGGGGGGGKGSQRGGKSQGQSRKPPKQPTKQSQSQSQPQPQARRQQQQQHA